MRIVSKTDKGMIRRTNQDAYATGELFENMSWAIVCDGMGGANGGNVAAVTAVKCIGEHISTSYRQGMSSNSIRIMLESAVCAANVEVYDMANSDISLKGMGTTAVAVLIQNSVAHIVHVGDSRAYIVSNGNLTQITRDHSLVQTMVDRGELTEEEARLHPQKNIITRAIGVDDRITVDYDEIELGEKDTLMICTDGLSNCVTNSEMLDVIKNNRFYDYPDRLVSLANQNGGQDNITVVFLSF